MYNHKLIRWMASVVVLLAMCCVPGALHAAPVQSNESPVMWFGTATAIPGAWSTLLRTGSGVAMNLHTADLPAGTADTVWWVVFNNPQNCGPKPSGPRCGDADLHATGVDASILHAAGHVVGADGVGNYGARLAVGDTSTALFGPGLVNPFTADIHLVVRTHGAPIPGLVDDQIHSFNGGCPPNTCTNIQASVHEAL